MCMVMGTKTISIDEEAYDRLKRKKNKGESFSEVIKRLIMPVKKNSPLDYFGIWDLNPEEMDVLKSSLKEFDEEFESMFG
jgi:predicted CopG family antitoxin